MGNVCFSCVDSGTVGFIEGCGAFKRVAHPGCNWINPFLCETLAGSLSLRLQQLDVHCETKTKDNVFVNIVVSVQYQVVAESLYDAFYRLTNSQTQIRSYVFDVVRASVPMINLDDVFLEKEEIANGVRQELQKVMGSFGYSILQALITDIDPAIEVKGAMNEINAAQRLRMSALERAEADKLTKIKWAEAEAEAKALNGQGIARQRQAILNGLQASVSSFAGDSEDILVVCEIVKRMLYYGYNYPSQGDQMVDVSSKEVMELLLVTQYFDMLKDVGQQTKGSTLFMSHGPGAVNEVAKQLRAAMYDRENGFAPPPAAVATRK